VLLHGDRQWLELVLFSGSVDPHTNRVGQHRLCHVSGLHGLSPKDVDLARICGHDPSASGKLKPTSMMKWIAPRPPDTIICGERRLTCSPCPRTTTKPSSSGLESLATKPIHRRKPRQGPRALPTPSTPTEPTLSAFTVLALATPSRSWAT
jgi:hypothetical protein